MRLSVNLNKVALLRNQRELELPSVTEAAKTVLRAGAHGITVHPRPDERHTRISDVHGLKSVVDEFAVELNVEGNPVPEFLALVEEVLPQQVTLVPDGPAAKTSDHGWDIALHQQYLTDITQRLQKRGMRVSVFVDYDAPMDIAAQIGVDAVELYTEPYARVFLHDGLRDMQDENLLYRYAHAAECAHALGLSVHAGHDLNLDNLAVFVSAIPALAEVSIGHAFTAEALWLGLAETTSRYVQILTKRHG